MHNAVPMSTRLHIVVPDDLLEQIDAARGDVSRSKWFLRAAERKLSIEVRSSEPEQATRTVPAPPSPRVPPVSQTWAR